MFIEQSATRLWRIRVGFVLLCLVPTIGLSGWAVRRHSVAHRQAAAAAATRLLGTEVTIAGVGHPRPGCFRLTGVRLEGMPLGQVEVESTPTEVRLRLDRCDCRPALMRLVAKLGNRWLTEPARFARNAVIEIDDLSWEKNAGDEPSARPVRLECVAAGKGRAVRIVSPTRAADEIRIVRTIESSLPQGQSRWEVDATLTEPVPVAVLIAVLEQSPLAGWRLGQGATIAGSMQSAATAGSWAGEASGRVTGADLAAVTASLPHRADGVATLDVGSLIWADNRVTAADLTLTAPRGMLAQEWLDGLISIIGCRAAPAALERTAAEPREFERLALRLDLDGNGARLRAEPQRAGCLVESQGLPLVFEPQAAVTLDRLAWLLSGTRAAAVPGTPVSAWLLSVLPLPQTSR